MRYKNGLKDFGYKMFILLMVYGVIGGGIFSLHGAFYGYVLFIIGVICIPIYIYDVRKFIITKRRNR